MTVSEPTRAGGKHPFVYQPPTAGQTKTIQVLRDAAKDLHDLTVGSIPASRERSIAISKLEEFSMWVNKAVVFTEGA